ncbi:phage holin family protein [Brachybacterium nesterenkovii]|uniref:phage holin family protein n=1 Tax=Brachybacterium nesterenkovii TaxID=47847 RepID=UPI00321B154E
MINTTNDPSTPPTQRSIGELVASIKDELVGVVHTEVDIAKKEFTSLGTKAGVIAACAAVVLFLLLSAWVMLLFAAASGLQALGLPAWASFLIVAGVFLLLAAIAGLIAYSFVKKLKAPEVTIETAKGAMTAVQGKRHTAPVSYDDTFEELYGKQVSARTASTPTPGAKDEKAPTEDERVGSVRA